MSALLGANIIKVKLPSDFLEEDPTKKAFEDNNNLTAAIDYENVYGEKFGYEIGAKATIRDFKKDMDYLGRTYENNYEEDIYAAYLVTRYNFTDRFGFKFGARTEQVETFAELDKKEVQDIDTSNVLTQLFDNGIEDSPFDKNYFKIFGFLGFPTI